MKNIHHLITLGKNIFLQTLSKSRNSQLSVADNHWLKGQSLVELLVTIGLSAVLLPALLTGLIATRSGRAQQDQRQQAVAYAREGEEAVRVVRDTDWIAFSALTPGVPYYLKPVSGKWTLSSTPDTLTNGLTRTIKISQVSRDFTDPNTPIVTTGGTLDPSTLKVTVAVAWANPLPSSVVDIEYLTRNGNQSHIETTQADFQKGTVPTTITTTKTIDGEVTLGPGTVLSDWCAPSLSLNAVDLPGQGITTAIAASFQHAYTTTGGNKSGDSMDSVSIPSVTTAQNDLPAYNLYKTYGIYADSTYEYLTSDHPGTSVDIVSIKPFVHKGTVDVGSKGFSVFVTGNTGYVTTSSKLYSFDVAKIIGGSTSPNATSYNLAGTGNKVLISGNFAYVATSSTTNQLQKINITNGQTTSLSVNTIAGSSNLTGVDISIDSTGSTAYLVTNYISNSIPDFFIVDLSTMTVKKTTSIPAKNLVYNTAGMDPRGVALIPGGRAIIVGSGGQQYQVLKTNDASILPANCGGLSNPNGASSINAVAFITDIATGNVYSYILTDNSNKEFQIIQGGPGGTSGLYALSGIFTSQTQPLTLAGNVAFNNFVANVSQSPTTTSVKFQIAVSPLVGGVCPTTLSSYNFVGPNGDATSYFTSTNNQITGLIPLGTFGTYQNPGQCIRYQATLATTDPNTTQPPILSDVTINYSP